MAWRPYENLIEGELDNTVPGKVTGWIRFLGMDEPVRLDLEGDFHRDIRGAKIRLKNNTPSNRKGQEGSYMRGFSPVQTGRAGDITAGADRGQLGDDGPSGGCNSVGGHWLYTVGGEQDAL